MSTILHLSDLHLNGDETWKNLESVIGTIRVDLREKPNLLVVSGDFTDHPGNGIVAKVKTAGRKMFGREPARGLREVKEKLETLRLACGKECPLVVVPGNHDYREFGITAWRNNSAAFDEIFPDWKTPTTLRIDSRLVVVFTIDSNTNDARINAARGRVGKDELIRFRLAYERSKKDNLDEFDSALKIVVLHHHPLPIADSEKTGYIGSDKFLGLDDSGIFLREMAARQIDIVLHGHKHHAFNTRIEISLQSVRRGLAIIAAGSATKESEAERSFNIIHVDQRSISGQVWSNKSGVTFLPGQKYPIVSYERYVARAFEDFIASKETSYVSKQVQFIYSIMSSGDADFYLRYDELKGTGNGAAEISVNRKCEQGTFSGHSWVMTTPHPAQIKFEQPKEVAPGELLGTVKFQPALQPTDAPVNIEQRFRLYNAFSLDQEQRRRITDKPNTEHVMIGIGKPTTDLTISVHFADTDLPKGIRSFAADKKTKNDDHDETARTRSSLRICPPSRTITLTVAKPLKSCNYFIEWDLPEAPPRRYSLVDRGRCNEIKSGLLALDARDQNKNPLAPVFTAERNRLAAEYGTPVHQIEVGLMVYDSTIKRLRFVAGELLTNSWNYQLFEGQGIAGRAHKLDRALIYVPGRVKQHSDFVALPPKGGLMPEIIICIPIRYPISTPEGVGETVAVVTISTYYGASEMLKLAENDESGKAISLEYQILFGEQILPKLGFAIWA